MNVTILQKLFRAKPTIAWSFCGILLGISVAINEYGFGLDWLYLAVAILPIVLLQGFVAHAVNDLEDEEVDKNTDMKATNRFKVLISGIASRKDLIIIAFTFFIITLCSALFLFIKLGVMILVFYVIGLYAALCYSLPPLKLGWRPYAEWTVVLPVLVTLVVAVNYVATGYLSYLAFIIGILFALFNIIWFLVSRLMDYEADKKAGKITTFVKYGLDYEILDYAEGVHPYLALVTMLLFLFIAYIGILINPFIGVVSFISWFAVNCFLPQYYELIPVVLSMKRTDLIFISIINSIVISSILIFL